MSVRILLWAKCLQPTPDQIALNFTAVGVPLSGCDLNRSSTYEAVFIPFRPRLCENYFMFLIGGVVKY
jgi:hypothetical protein